MAKEVSGLNRKEFPVKKIVSVLAGLALAFGTTSMAHADDTVYVPLERPATSVDDSGVNHLVLPDSTAGVTYNATEQATAATCGQVNVFAHVHSGYRQVGADMYHKLFYFSDVPVYFTTVDLGACAPRVVVETVTRTKVVKVKVVKRAGKVVKRTKTVTWK